MSTVHRPLSTAATLIDRRVMISDSQTFHLEGITYFVPMAPGYKAIVTAECRRGHLMLRTDERQRYLATPLKPSSPNRAKKRNNSIQKENMIVQPLTPEALQHFKLQQDPFRDEIRSREDILWTKEHRQVLDLMLQSARNQSFVAIVAEKGSGKTLVKREFMQKRPDSIRIIQPMFPDKRVITPNNILDAIIEDLGGTEARIKSPAKRERKVRLVHELLCNISGDGGSVCLLLDEAHDFNQVTLRSLKRFHEMEKGFSRLMSIILVGQREFLPNLFNVPEVQQRCAVYIMKGLGKEAHDYLEHKLKRAGSTTDKIFTAEAVRSLFQACSEKGDDGRIWGPFPLLVNVVALKAMNTAAKLGEKTVTPKIIDTVRVSLATTQEASR